MLGLDPRSIILMSGVMSLLMAGMLAVMRRGYPRSVKGMSAWALSFVIAFVATLLIGSYDRIPHLLTTVLGNCTMLYSATLSLYGSQRFYGQPTQHRYWALAVLGCAMVFAWFTFVQPSYLVRIQVFSLVMIGIQGAHAALLFRCKAQNRFAIIAATFISIQVAILVLRVITLAANHAAQGVFDPSLMQVIHIAAYGFLALLLTVSLVLMASERMRAEFEHVATHDHLTGALSRGAFIQECEQELERCQRHGRVMTLVMMDLDHFKQINDTHGHLVGDRVLIDFVQQVSDQLRKPDRIGRFGGEEFVLVLPETPHDEAIQVAERIRHSIATNGSDPSYTVSIGLATTRLELESVDQLVARADAALYRAKAAGRNRVDAG